MRVGRRDAAARMHRGPSALVRAGVGDLVPVRPQDLWLEHARRPAFVEALEEVRELHRIQPARIGPSQDGNLGPHRSPERGALPLPHPLRTKVVDGLLVIRERRGVAEVEKHPGAGSAVEPEPHVDRVARCVYHLSIIKSIVRCVHPLSMRVGGSATVSRGAVELDSGKAAPRSVIHARGSRVQPRRMSDSATPSGLAQTTTSRPVCAAHSAPGTTGVGGIGRRGPRKADHPESRGRQT
mmetsp:Transcript_31612/g.100800  ORF Transcript_31612/g.100800 Transcript_31612/m.100800 type:complete len:239 (+) Transcript_31612:198-914(+)